MRKLILTNYLSPGDILMLTAAVRDLHRWYPRQFLTDVRTPCPGLWENNPHITPLKEGDPGVEVIECHYPLIHKCNQLPYHFLHGFIQFLNDKLRLNISPTSFKGDVYLSRLEKSWPSQVHQVFNEEIPFWVIVAGGKRDYTIKWWETARFQEVVDYFRGRILFVQVGENGHHHPPLNGVVNLCGQTDLRQLIRLVHHSQGVLSPVSLMMHLAAAIESKAKPSKSRPCVVVAGGREPPHWEAYPTHQFIHTIGALACCDTGGCWRSRTLPLGDGDEKDRRTNLCKDVVGSLPRCMDMITSTMVVQRIETYFEGRNIQYLNKRQSEKVAYKLNINPRPTNTVSAIRSVKQDKWRNIHHEKKYRDLLQQAVNQNYDYPQYRFKGRGIVICGGGPQYYPCAWVCIHMLRSVGCTLPIQLWHLGPKEMGDDLRRLIEPLGVECVDGLLIAKEYPARILRGWEIKPYSIIHSSFEEVLSLDADNVCAKNPEYLFDTPQYKEHGSVFWPDYGRLSHERDIWAVCGVAYQDEPEFESGQIVVNKKASWKALQVTMHLNEYSDHYYRHMHGDKETFHMAYRRVGKSYAMPSKGIFPLKGTMCQHDFDGNRVFQHRNHAKWSLFNENPRIRGFLLEDECLMHLEKLQALWDFNLQGVVRFSAKMTKTPRELAAAKELIDSEFLYERVGYDSRPMSFLMEGRIGEGAAGREVYWDVKEAADSRITLSISCKTELTCRLTEEEPGVWAGKWEIFEQMPIRLSRTRNIRNVTVSAPFFDEVGGHYDSRFYQGSIRTELYREKLIPLLRAFSDLCTSYGVTPILMHGSLIGWYWNQKFLPWDDDIDLCLFLEDLSEMQARLKGRSQQYDLDKYLFEINPNFQNRTSLNQHYSDRKELNKIDARFIDKQSGLFIDITALSRASSNSLTTKCPHIYNIPDIIPLQLSNMEGIPVGIPANVKQVLSQEYGDQVLTEHSFGKYQFNQETCLWVYEP